MKQVDVDVKSKGESLGVFPYEFPETLEEAIALDGPEKVFSLFAQQRKIRFADGKRAELTGSPTKGLASKLKEAPPEVLAQIAKLLGMQL